METEVARPETVSGCSKYKIPLIIAAIVLALVVVCVAAVLILWKAGLLPFLPFFGPKQVLPGLMPQDASVYISVDPQLEDLAGFQRLVQIYGDIEQVQEAIDDFTEEMKEETDISFDEDVKPWLGGEAGFAITSIDQVLRDEDPVFILGATTRDVKASDAFLQKVKQQMEADGYTVSKKAYQNVAYYAQEAKEEWETPMFFGTVKRAVIMTSEEGEMEKVIDLAKGGEGSLAESEAYIEMVEALPAGSAAYMFMDMQALLEALPEEMEGQFGFQQLDFSADAFHAMGMALNFDLEASSSTLPSPLTPRNCRSAPSSA